MPQFHVIRLTCPSPINWSLINTTLLQSTAIRNLEHHTNKQILVFPKQSHCEWLFLFSLSFLSFFYSAKHTAVTCWQWPLSWQSFSHTVTTDNSSAPEADVMHVFSFVFVQCSFAKGFFLLPRAYLLLPLLSAGWAWVWVIHCVLHMVLTARSSYSGSKALQTCLFVRRDAPALPVRCTFVAKPCHGAARTGRATWVHVESDLLEAKEGKVKAILAVTTRHTLLQPEGAPKAGCQGKFTQLAQARESSSAHATTCMLLQADRYFAVSTAYMLSPSRELHSLNKFSSKASTWPAEPSAFWHIVFHPISFCCPQGAWKRQGSAKS